MRAHIFIFERATPMCMPCNFVTEVAFFMYIVFNMRCGTPDLVFYSIHHPDERTQPVPIHF